MGPEVTSLVFTGPLGGVLRRGNFHRAAGWSAAVSKVGVPGLHLDDLRHTGNMLAAPGARLANLKGRMGHDIAGSGGQASSLAATFNRSIAAVALGTSRSSSLSFLIAVTIKRSR